MLRSVSREIMVSGWLRARVVASVCARYLLTKNTQKMPSGGGLRLRGAGA
jgi:hypothetical protein